MEFAGLEVFVNGERLALAGSPDLAVLTATLAFPAHDSSESDRRIALSVGGLSAGEPGDSEFRNWLSQHSLPYGSEITIRFIPIEQADSPAEVYPNPPEAAYARERDQFLALKREYLRLRERFEPHK
jgi:hypothetical protein